MIGKDYTIHFGRADQHRWKVRKGQRSEKEAHADGDTTSGGTCLSWRQAARKNTVKDNSGNNKCIPARLQ